MDPALRNLLPHSHWVWILGLLLLLIATLWGVGLAAAYWRSRVQPDFKVRALSQVQRARYKRLITEVRSEYEGGLIDARGAHLALAAIIRAAATERTRINLESSTAHEAIEKVPGWPVLPEALAWCADGSFPTSVADQRVEQGLKYADEVACR